MKFKLGWVCLLLALPVAAQNLGQNDGISYQTSEYADGIAAVLEESPAAIVPNGVPNSSQPKSSFLWIGTDSNTIFDAQTLNLLAPRMTVTVLNAPLTGTAPKYNFASIVQGFRELNPQIALLSYAWSSRYKPTARIAEVTLHGYDKLPYLILDTDGQVHYNGKGYIFGDVTQSGYINWLGDRLSGITQQIAANGVALDLSFRTPLTTFMACCNSDPQFCPTYATGMDQLMGQLNNTLQPGLLIYNGLWNTVPNVQLSDQVNLLKNTDGALIEYFGFDPDRNFAAFQQMVLPFLNILQTYPNKIIMAAGRGSWEYTNYQGDYLLQRYLYASYLLGRTPNSLFKYTSSFQAPTEHGRCGGIDLYADADIALGTPNGTYQLVNGVYVRSFSLGLVLVAPNDSPASSYTLSSPYYTPEGKLLQGTITLQPGTGVLLLNYKPATPALFQRTFEGATPPGTDWRWAQIQASGTNHWLHVDTASEIYEHDLMLDWVHQLSPKTNLTLQVRSDDTAAQIQAVVEVDDPNGQTFQAVVPVRFGNQASQAQVFLAYRSKATNTTNPMPYLTTTATATADGSWHTITLSPTTVNSQGYILKRWVFVRLLGSMDVDNLAIN
jgi:hypothetical protein